MGVTEKYVDAIKERVGLSREPEVTTTTPTQINNTSHTCEFVKEERQTHPTLTSYICKVRGCGRGMLS